MGFNSGNTNENMDIRRRYVPIPKQQIAERLFQEHAQHINSSCHRHAENITH